MTLNELISGVTRRFSDCGDFIVRNITVNNAQGAICCIRELTDKNYVAEKIIRPLLKHCDYTGFTGFDGVLQTVGIEYTDDIDGICNKLCTGNALVAIDNGRLFSAVCSGDSYFGRSSDKSETDITTKGPQAGFVEDIEKNICLLRRIIRSPALKCLDFRKGDITKTRISVLYVEGRAPKKLIGEAVRRIESIKASAIVDSGNIETLIRDERYGFLPTFGSTEKVDKAASLLTAGRAVIICDGSPFVLTCPYMFIESIQSSEDYLRSPYYATFMRILRLLSLLTALYLPSAYLIFTEQHRELMPGDLMAVIDGLRKEVPVSLFAELLIMLLVFEMLREVGVRMPRTVGDAVGIVGSIVIGDAATKAGIASTSVILVVAISAVANFVVPVYMNTTTILRLLFLIVTQIAGYPGLIAATGGALCLICSKTSMGEPYMKPLVPFELSAMLDFIVTVPQKVLGRNEGSE